MADSVRVVFPWRGGCAHRAIAFAWVRLRFKRLLPEWPLARSQAPPGPWCKAAAVAPALHETEAEIVVVHDADVWCGADALRAAAAAVQAGAPWAVPHRHVYRLTEEGTQAVYDGGRLSEQEVVEHRYFGGAGGGIVVAPRETLLEVPPDPRFTGWGHEDVSWGIALEVLAGRPWRGKAPLYHLWHPPQARIELGVGSRENEALWKRYAHAKKYPQKLRELIEEVA